MRLLHYLLQFLMAPVMLGFAAAPVVVPEVGGADVSSGDAGNESGDDAGDTATGGETAVDVDGAEATAKTETSPEAKPDAKVDNRSLPPKVREMMEQLKTADPKAHGFLKDVLFRDRAWRQEFPNGIQEAKALKEQLAALPEGGIQALTQEKAEWDSIDEAYNAADPRFLDIMHEANPESFNKIAPLVVSKFAQTDPEGYQRHMAGIMVATFQSGNIGGKLNFATRLIAKGDTEGAAAEIKDIADWVAGIDQLAKTQPKPVERDPQLDQRERELQAREDQQWVSQTASDVNTFKTSAIKKELAQYAKGAQIDDETYQAIEDQALKYLNSILMADPNFAKTFNSYVEHKDRDGVVKYMKSRLQELLPSKAGKMGPVEKAYKLFFRGGTSSTTPKPKPPQAAAGTKGAPAAAPPAGWVKVGKAPSPAEIDMKASPFEMRFKQAAVLKSGKKVFWGANAPA